MQYDFAEEKVQDDFVQRNIEQYSQLEPGLEDKTIVHNDWLCSRCQSQNFSRRTECYRCKAVKTSDCQIVAVEKKIKQ